MTLMAIYYQRFFLFTTLLLGTILIALGIFALAGVVEIKFNVGSNKSDELTAVTGPVIQEVGEIPHILETYFRAYRGYSVTRLMKYSGTWIDCWIEVRYDGKKQIFAEKVGKDLRQMYVGRHDKPKAKEVSGYLLLVHKREKEGLPGYAWDIVLTGGHRTVFHSIKIPMYKRGGSAAPNWHPWGGIGTNLRKFTEELSLYKAESQQRTIDGDPSHVLELKCKPAKSD